MGPECVRASANGHGLTVYITTGSSQIVARVLHLTAGNSDKVALLTGVGSGHHDATPSATLETDAPLTKVELTLFETSHQQTTLPAVPTTRLPRRPRMEAAVAASEERLA